MATFKVIKNNAFSTVVSGELNNTTDPVTFDIATGDGDKFPTVTNGFWATVWDAQYNDPGQDPDMEILLVTARTGDEFVATRGQLGTSAVAHAGEPKIALLFVDQQMKDVQDAINDLDVATTKGDLLVFNGTNYVRVGVGSNDQVLTADSAEASGVKWAAASGGGSSTPRVEFSVPFIALDPTAGEMQYGVFYTSSGTVTKVHEYNGLRFFTGASSSRAYLNTVNEIYGDIFDLNPEFIFRGYWYRQNDGEYYISCKLGGHGTASTYPQTNKSFGYFTSVVSSVCTSYAQHYSGSTEISTDVSGTLGLNTSATNSRWIRCVMDSGTDIKFYFNGTLVATHTTSLPTGALTTQYSPFMLSVRSVTNPSSTNSLRFSSLLMSWDEA